MDETREQVLRERAQRDQGHPATEEEIFAAVAFRARLVKAFYSALIGLNFSDQDAVTITAGQRF